MKEVSPSWKTHREQREVGTSVLVSLFLLFSNFTGQSCLEATSRHTLGNFGEHSLSRSVFLCLPAIWSRGEQEAESNRLTAGPEKEGKNRMLAGRSHRDEKVCSGWEGLVLL